MGNNYSKMFKGSNKAQSEVLMNKEKVNKEKVNAEKVPDELVNAVLSTASSAIIEGIEYVASEGTVVGMDLENESDESVAEYKILNEEIQVDLPEPKKVFKTAIVNVKFLNVRSDPYKTSQKVQVLKMGDKVTVVEYMEEWVKICNPTNRKKYAYVMVKHIT